MGLFSRHRAARVADAATEPAPPPPAPPPPGGWGERGGWEECGAAG